MVASTGTSPTGAIGRLTMSLGSCSAPRRSATSVALVDLVHDDRSTHGQHRDDSGGDAGDCEVPPSSAAGHLAGQRGEQRGRQWLVRRRVFEHLRVDPSEQTGQTRELLHGPGALVAGGQVPLELQALARAEGAEDVRRIVVGELAAHALTPISSSASFSARSA